MSASSTGWPSPSRTAPTIRIASGSPGETRRSPPSYGSAYSKNGPTVCEGVVSGITPWRGLAAAQHDVPLVAERPLRLGRIQVEARDQPLANGRIADRLEDRVLPEQGIAREVHLRHQPRRERGSE